jgi:hypothetical protein
MRWKDHEPCWYDLHYETCNSVYLLSYFFFVQEHLSRTGTNGPAVADFVRNIQQSEVHVPNDFRHLGIAPGPRDDGSDNISITGISATAVPYTQVHICR